MVWNRECLITIILHLCVICYEVVASKPGGVEIECNTSAFGLCWWKFIGPKPKYYSMYILCVCARTRVRVCVYIFVNNMCIHTFYVCCSYCILQGLFMSDNIHHCNFSSVLHDDSSTAVAAVLKSLSMGTCILVKCIAVNRRSSCTIF
jgi:hypothetical protein